MAQAARADAEVRRMSESDATRAMENPVEFRRGTVRSVTLTIPLLSEQNTYLVVRLPESAVKDLMDRALALPEPEREPFIKEWVMRNQEALLEQYLVTEEGSRSFRYDIVPVRSDGTEIAARPQAPAQGQAPQEAPAQEAQPSIAAAIPSRTGSPAAEDISIVRMPRAEEAPPLEETHEAAESGASDEAPLPAPRQASFVFSGEGNGTREDPLIVQGREGRASGRDAVAIPIHLVDLDAHIKIFIRRSDLSDESIGRTTTDLKQACALALVHLEFDARTIQQSGLPAAIGMALRRTRQALE